MPQVDWAEVAANGYAVPEGVNAAEQVPELLEMLGHPDPVVRDGQAYVTLAEWLEKGHLDGVLRDLGDQCAVNLRSENVLLRSFSALILAEIVSRDAEVRQFSAENLRHLQDAWASWFVQEPDLRSYDEVQGWLHALAHGADVATALAQHPALTRTDLNRLLDALLRRIAGIEVLPAQYEDDRVALAAFLLLSNGKLTATDQKRWLVKLRRQVRPAWGQPRSAAVAFAVQVARALLMFTQFGAKLPSGKVVLRTPELQRWLWQVLHEAFSFAYPSLDNP